MKITFTINYDILTKNRRYCRYIFSEICVQFVHVYFVYIYNTFTVQHISVPCKKKAIKPLTPSKVNEQ
jgi:hypothetical protein